MASEPLDPVWANPEKTIILLTLPERWRAQDFIEARIRTNTMRDEVDHVVHSIIDARKTLKPPADMVMRMGEINALEHKRAGVAVWIVAEATEMYTVIFDIYKHMYTYDLPIVPSMEAALAYIEQHAQ